MTDNSLTVSKLPQTSNIAQSDRIMILYNANSTLANASVRTIAVNNFFSNTIPGPYLNDSAASTAGIVIGQLYHDTSGYVKMRIT